MKILALLIASAFTALVHVRTRHVTMEATTAAVVAKARPTPVPVLPAVAQPAREQKPNWIVERNRTWKNPLNSH